MMEEEKLYQECLVAFKKEDFSSFSSFYEKTKRPVFYNIYSLTKSYEDSEELLQETYVRFLETLERVKDGSKLLGYLMVLSRNLTLDHLKKKKHLPLEEEKFRHLGEEDKRFFDTTSLLSSIQKVLRQKEFEIFVLHVLSERTFEEIAKLQKRPLGSVLWSYSNALKKIRKELPYETFR